MLASVLQRKNRNKKMKGVYTVFSALGNNNMFLCKSFSVNYSGYVLSSVINYIIV